MTPFASTATTKAIRVLVVDDNADARLMVHTFLSLLGFEVCSAESGRDALASAEEFKPDVVFLDLWMPDIDGVETCLRLRRGPCPRPIRIVALTADALGAQAVPSCFDCALTKPVDLDALAGLVTQRADLMRRSSAKLQ